MLLILWLIAIIGCSCGASLDGKVEDLATDLENWMSKLPDKLRQVPLNYLAIPGAHDSFTVDISASSEVSPDGQEILKALQFLTVVRTVMANWSKTQGYNVLGQLQTGVRFFDLRFCRNFTTLKLYFCHGMYSTEVATVLSDMASYLNDHPKEVVILDCQHFYNFTSATHTEVIELLKTNFGDKLVPYASDMSALTLNNLAASNKQVLVVYRDEARSGEASLWPTESFPTPWYDTMDHSYLISSLNNGLASRPTGTGYISQLVLTPKIDDIIKYVLSSLKKKCAQEFQNDRIQWLSEQTPGPQGVNVIIADFVDLDDNIFSKTVINLNQKLDIAQLNRNTMLEQIAQLVNNLLFRLTKAF